MQHYTVYFIWKLLYMFQVVPPTHHQEHIQLYLQHLIFVTPLLLPAAIAAGSSNGLFGYILEYFKGLYDYYYYFITITIQLFIFQ